MNRKLYIALLLAIIVLPCFGLFYLHVKQIYVNGNGEKRALLLSEAIKRFYINNGYYPDELLQEIDAIGFFSDAAGVRFELSIKNDSSFMLTYSPKLDSLTLIGNSRKEKLTIRWNKNMTQLDVQTSIKRP